VVQIARGACTNSRGLGTGTSALFPERTDDLVMILGLRAVRLVQRLQLQRCGEIARFGGASFVDADIVELETRGLCKPHVTIRDDLKRTWSRETRFDRQRKGHLGPRPQLTGKYAKPA